MVLNTNTKRESGRKA
jgi:T-complex protein 1 subunit gamma